jgi:hypothetical protein
MLIRVLNVLIPIALGLLGLNQIAMYSQLFSFVFHSLVQRDFSFRLPKQPLERLRSLELELEMEMVLRSSCLPYSLALVAISIAHL